MSHTHLDRLHDLSVDCVIFGFEGSRLQVLLIRRAVAPFGGSWSLPGGFILRKEALEAAPARVLREMTGVEDVYLEQVGAFGGLDRYPGERVITLAYFALIKPGNYPLHPGSEASEARWFAWEAVPALPFDHRDILDAAFETLQRRVRHQPVGFELLPEKFTLYQLQALYEAILQRPLDKPNFRRKLMRMNLLHALEERQQGVAHRAAKLYYFDHERYEALQQAGFVFEI
jgi:8-oxo-dGTP diphosphatase